MRRSTLASIIILILIILGVAAYAIGHKPSTNQTNANGNTPNSNTPSAASNIAPGSVDIRNTMFTPSQITVDRGAKVTWTNNDSTVHTVTADKNNLFDSGSIQPGATYSYTFTQSGSYQYHCTIHPSMHATIVVR